MKLWIKVFVITLFIVLFIRTFLIQSYTISSSQMETALLKGDLVLVDKTSYGIRMPMTPLTIPFTHNYFFGIKSYSDLIQLNYRRLLSSQVKRNDVILFNNPLETAIPTDKRSLFISRCVALPNDTIYVDGLNYYINGNKYALSPDLLLTFSIGNEAREHLITILDQLKIEKRNIRIDSLFTYLDLNRYEAYLIDQNLSMPNQLCELNNDLSYKLIVPSKGMNIAIDSINLNLYVHVISQELNGKVEVINNNMYLNDSLLRSYQFKNDYYWLLSDNIDLATDSRKLGFISETNIIGKAKLIWFSSDKSSIRKDRILAPIK